MHFITIATFYNLQECYMSRGVLENEGITCFLADEHTVATQPHKAHLFGGIKLQVEQKNTARANQILVAAGIISPTEHTQSVTQSNNFLEEFEKWTSSIPGLKKMNLLFRLLTVVVVLTLAISISLLAWNKPTLKQRLTENIWCVDGVFYNGKEVNIHSTGVTITFIDDPRCSERVTFVRNGEISMPGIDSYPALGYWELEDNRVKIIIRDPENLAKMYSGMYDVDWGGNRLVLESTNTKIELIQLKIF